MDTIRAFLSKIRALFFDFQKRTGEPPLPPSSPHALVARMGTDYPRLWHQNLIQVGVYFKQEI